MHASFIWGTILILLGTALLFKSIFQITVPLVRPFIGCVMIYFGLSIMMDPFTDAPEKKTVLFGNAHIIGQKPITQYNIVFGSTEIDLRKMDLSEETEIALYVVFGSCKLILNPDVATKVRVQALVARASLPDETLVSFGRNVYTTVNAEPRLRIQAYAVFSNLEVVVAACDNKESQMQPLQIDERAQEA